MQEQFPCHQRTLTYLSTQEDAQQHIYQDIDELSTGEEAADGTTNDGNFVRLGTYNAYRILWWDVRIALFLMFHEWPNWHHRFISHTNLRNKLYAPATTVFYSHASPLIFK